MAVQPFSGRTRVMPGHVASYAIWVWSARAESHGVQLTTKVTKVRGAGSARFTVCPDLRGSACRLGSLPVGQPDELQATVKVTSTATAGEKIRLTAKVQATGVAAVYASAEVAVVATTTPSPSPAPSVPGTGLSSGGGLPPPSMPGIPTSSGDGSLFPTVTPGSSTAASPQPGPTPARHHPSIRAATVSATVPLNTRLIGGQLAGLAVLAGAIAMAIARLSLRTSRPGDGKNSPD